jgi:serine/threonine protein kinase
MRRSPSTPPELAGYTYERLLGTGGFSDVFLYEQRLPRRKVAVKVLVADQLDENAKHQFVAEANVMAQLSAHPYIVTIHHADIAGDRPFLVMEYCSGPSLAERYKQEQLSVEFVLRTGVRLASAVATAHSVGILHRDIKPANVLTNEYGWPALTDFGIASAIEGELPVHTTTGLTPTTNDTSSAGSAVGLSVPWSPPEMFADDPQPDVRSDVFSLAATIHTLLAGRTPFEVRGRSNGTLDLIGRIERGQITPLERTDLPSSLNAVLRKGMATDPAARYQSALEFARALQRVELELGYASTSIEVPSSITSSVAARAEHDGADEADETRARTVTTIQAQEVERADDDETRLRSPTTVTAQPSPQSPVAPGGHDVEDGTVIRAPKAGAMASDADAAHGGVPAAEPSRPRNRIGLIIGAAAVVVVGAAVAGALALSGSLAAPEPTHTRTSSPDSAIVGGVPPTPTFSKAVASADGTTVTFTFVNPDPQDGDAYRWSLLDSPDTVSRSDSPVIVVSDATPGDRFCIDIRLQRTDGTVSEPAKGCSK